MQVLTLEDPATGVVHHFRFCNGVPLNESNPQGLRTTFSCVFEGFLQELSSHYIINTNCNALYSPIHYRKVANM